MCSVRITRQPDSEWHPVLNREMYGSEVRNTKIGAYTGTVTGPYYYPDPAADIYHPIYKSSAGRYCHEKNRD